MKKAGFLLGVAGCAVVAGLLALFMPQMAQTQSYSSPMRDVDNPARQPVNLQPNIEVKPNGENGFNYSFYIVPAGKRLMISYVGLYNTIPNGKTGLAIVVSASNPNNLNPTSSAVAPISNGAPYSDMNGFHPVVASQQVSMFGNPGDRIDVMVATDGGPADASFGLININGYLVNLP